MFSSDVRISKGSSCPVRVAISGLPPLLSGILRAAVAEQSDVTICSEISATDPTWEDPSRIAADVLLLGVANPSEAGEARRILRAAPALRVLLVSTDGKETAVYELSPRRTFLGELSPDELLDTIRSPEIFASDWDMEA